MLACREEGVKKQTVNCDFMPFADKPVAPIMVAKV
jgi:hypothetical protein